MQDDAKTTVRLRSPQRGQCELVIKTPRGLIVCPVTFEQLRGIAADGVEILAGWPVRPE